MNFLKLLYVIILGHIGPPDPGFTDILTLTFILAPQVHLTLSSYSHLLMVFSINWYALIVP